MSRLRVLAFGCFGLALGATTPYAQGPGLPVPKRPGTKTPAPKKQAPKKQAPKKQGKDLAKRVRDACGTNMLIRMQAARRVGKGGAAAVDAVLTYTKDKGINALSAELVSALGGLRSAKLRSSMRQWVEDANFAWRPQALLALAQVPEAEDGELFRRYLNNGSWLMRRSALSGVARLGGESSTKQLEAGLRDADWRVAVRAAALLIDKQAGTRKQRRPKRLEKGEEPPAAKLPEHGKAALPVLVRALDAEDVFFGDDFGALARKEAFDALRAWCSRDFGYRPRAPQAVRRGAIARFRRLVETLTEETIEAAPKAPLRAWRFGFERRSCREGDLVLRIDAQGRLWRGAFKLERVEIQAGDRKELMRMARAVPAPRKRSFGRIRCDLTRFAGLGATGNLSLRAAPDALPESLSKLEKAMLSFEAK